MSKHTHGDGAPGADDRAHKSDRPHVDDGSMFEHVRPIDPGAITLDELRALLAARGVCLHSDGTHLQVDDPSGVLTIDVEVAICRFEERLARIVASESMRRTGNDSVSDDGADRRSDREQPEQTQPNDIEHGEPDAGVGDGGNIEQLARPPIDPERITLSELLTEIVVRGIGFTLTSGDGVLEWIDPNERMTDDLAVAIWRYERQLVDALGPSRLPSEEEIVARRWKWRG